MEKVSCVMSAASSRESPCLSGMENTRRSYLSSSRLHARGPPLRQRRIRSRSGSASVRLLLSAKRKLLLWPVSSRRTGLTGTDLSKRYGSHARYRDRSHPSSARAELYQIIANSVVYLVVANTKRGLDFWRS